MRFDRLAELPSESEWRRLMLDLCSLECRALRVALVLLRVVVLRERLTFSDSESEPSLLSRFIVTLAVFFLVSALSGALDSASDLDCSTEHEFDLDDEEQDVEEEDEEEDDDVDELESDSCFELCLELELDLESDLGCSFLVSDSSSD